MIKLLLSRKSLFCLFVTLSGLSLQDSFAQNVTNIYTDFSGWWASGIGSINASKPNDQNNLLGFTAVRVISGVPTTKTFSTGVDDNLLTSKGISFAPGDYRALPVGQISGTPGSSTYVGIGNNYGGVNQSVTHPSLTNPMNYYLTDGRHGLDMGTAVFNIQNGSIFYKVDEFNIAAIGDGMPDIIATQMGDYPTANDVFKFVDINGATVGNQISLDFSQVISVGNASWSFYTVPTVAPFVPLPYGGPHGDRLMRLRAWDLSDFGLNQTNVGRISRFVHTLSGFSDPAFMAYNTTGFRALTTIIPGCGIVTPGLWLQANDGIAASGDKVTAWTDQGSKALNVEQSTAANRPTYKDGTNTGFNFNPYIDFDNGTWLGHSNSPFNAASDNMEVFVVARANASSGTNKILGFSKTSGDASSTTRGDYPAFNFNAAGDLNFSYGSDSKVTAATNGHSVPGLWQLNYSRSNGAITSSLNGVSSAGGTGSVDLGTWYTQLGDASPGDNQSDFDLGEVIVFPANISADQRQKTSSYLGIKYGISLPANYVSGSGSVVWDYSNNIYNNRIIGVGREDCQGLAQKQSSSIADERHLLTVGMGTIANTTKENLAILADGQYMMWGDNNGSLSNMTSLQAQNLCLKKPDLTWRNQRTGAYINTQNTQVKVHVSEINWAEPSRESSAGNYYLLIDRNANGSYLDAGDGAIAATSLSGGYATFDNVVWDHDGSGTDLFTIALKADDLPVLSAITGSNTSCIGSTTELTNSFASGTWSSSNEAVATVDPTTGMVTGLAPGTCIISYTATNTKGCTTTVTKGITVNNAPTAVLAGGGTACENQPSPNVSITFTGASPWSFIYTNGATSTTISNNTTNPYLLSGLSSGTYTLTALNDIHCAGTFSGSATVTIVSPPTASIIQPSYAGDKGSVQVTQPLGSDILYSINGVDYQSSTLFTNLDPGVYNVTAKNVTCTSSASVVTINATPTAPAPSVSQPTCIVPTGKITIPVVDGAQYSIDGGLSYQAGNIFDDLTPGSYSVVVNFLNGCVSPAQSVTINPQPATAVAPAVTTPVSYCKGAMATQLVASGINLLWYSTADGGVGVSTAPTPNTETSETKLYYVSQTNASGCESSRSSIEVTVKPTPSTPTITVLNNCDGTSTLTAENYTGALLWNTAATSAIITVNSAGSYTVNQFVNGCASAKATALASPRSIPATPVIDVVNNCNGTSTMTAGNYSGTLLWSNGANAGSQIVNIADTYLLVQTVNGCVSGTASATTAPKTTPATPTVTVVNNCGSSLLTASGGTGTFLWSNSETTSSVTVTSAGSYSVTRSVNGCPSAAGAGVAAPKSTTAPTGSSTQSFCENTAPTVASLTASGTGIKWYDASSGGNLLLTSAALVNGKIYYASQTLTGCESVSRLPVTVSLTSTASPTGNAAQTFCMNENAKVANLLATGNSIKWYEASSGGTALLSSQALTIGKTYYASQTDNGCESIGRLSVAVAIASPQAPTGAASQIFCRTDAPTIASLNISGTNLKWYDASVNGNLVLATQVLETGKTYYASQSTGACESLERLAILVTLDETPTESIAGPNQQHCNDPLFVMKASAPVVGTGMWKVTTGTATIAVPSDPTSDITVPEGQTAVLSWTISNGSCSSVSSVTLSNIFPASAGPDQLQNSTVFTMAADNGEGVWQIISVSAGSVASDVKIVDPTLYNTKITIPNGATVSLSWTANGSSCSDIVVLKNNSSLPVTLISFTASASNGGVDLKWSTSAETSNEGFNVERSLDARIFSVIGFVAANTGSDTKIRQNYQYHDGEPLGGTTYYRLGQKDHDGTVTYSRIVAVEIPKTLPAVELFPNPSQDIVYLKYLHAGSRVSLINNNGLVVSTTTSDFLDISKLIPGAYYIRIENGVLVRTLKFIKIN